MRIIGRHPHPRYKITFMALGERWVIQVEDGPYAQHYRIAQDVLPNGLVDLQQVIDADFLEAVRECFLRQHQAFVPRVKAVRQSGSDKSEA